MTCLSVNAQSSHGAGNRVTKHKILVYRRRAFFLPGACKLLGELSANMALDETNIPGRLIKVAEFSRQRLFLPAMPDELILTSLLDRRTTTNL